MSHDNARTQEYPSKPFYELSEQAHGDLRRVEECMVLLALLASQRMEDTIIAPARWTSLFEIIGSHIADVLDSTPWHADLE